MDVTLQTFAWLFLTVVPGNPAVLAGSVTEPACAAVREEMVKAFSDRPDVKISKCLEFRISRERT